MVAETCGPCDETGIDILNASHSRTGSPSAGMQTPCQSSCERRFAEVPSHRELLATRGCGNEKGPKRNGPHEGNRNDVPTGRKEIPIGPAQQSAGRSGPTIDPAATPAIVAGRRWTMWRTSHQTKAQQLNPSLRYSVTLFLSVRGVTPSAAAASVLFPSNRRRRDRITMRSISRSGNCSKTAGSFCGVPA